MSIRISGAYRGNKRVELRHEASGALVTTSAPVDNHGDGKGFSPTDLVSGALGACMLTLVAIVAERNQIDVSGMHFSVEKIMSANPRRIGELPIAVHLPQVLDETARQKLENAARTCPVFQSLHADIKVDLRFVYDV